MALVVIVMLAFNIPTALAAVWADFKQMDMIETMRTAREVDPDESPMSDEELEAHDDRAASIALVWLAVYIITAIAWVTWYKRMYANLPALGAKHIRFTPGWAVGGWFVPFLNLVRPYEIAQELWSGSAPSPEPPPPPPSASIRLGGAELEETRIEKRKQRIRTRARAESSGLVKAWWGCWIGWNAIAVVASKLEGAAMESFNPLMSDAQYAAAIDSFRTATNVTAFSDALDVPMAVLAIFVVRALNTRQQSRADEVASRGDDVALASP